MKSDDAETTQVPKILVISL